MTRREEIINNIGYKMTRAALDYVEKHEFADTMDAFEAGAQWADKTMIEKACKWLLNIDFDGQEFRDCDESFNNDLFVDAFRKAMEK